MPLLPFPFRKRPSLFVIFVVVTAYAIWGYGFAPDRLPELGLNPPRPAEQYYNQLTEGFMDGHLYLNREIPPQLLRLRDPYDRKANIFLRAGKGISNEGSIHDLSYYKGRFYLYFSAVPVITIFLPYALLTGTYLHQVTACVIFCAIGFCAQACVLAEMRKRFWDQISESRFCFLLVALGTLNLCPLLLRRADVWEVPVACGYAFASISIYFASKLYFSRQSRARDIILLGTSIAFAIVCRPTLIVFTPLCLIPLWNSFHFQRTKFFATIVYLAVPAALIGTIAIWYNYARFENAMEFGMHYQLSGDPRNLVLFSSHYLFFGLKTYLFCFRGFDTAFPFLTLILPHSYPPGYLGIERPVGLFTCLPAIPVGLFFLIYKNRIRSVAPLLIVLAVTASLSLLSLASFIGATLRYEFEFEPVFALLSVIGMLKVFSIESAQDTRVMSSLATFALALSILFIFLEINSPLTLYLNPLLYRY